MSCISVDIWPVVLYNISTSVTRIGGANITVGTVPRGYNVNVGLTLPSLLTTISASNSRLTLLARSANTKVHTTINIVCSTSWGEEVFLEVLEGRLITIDGQYIKVLKEDGL